MKFIKNRLVADEGYELKFKNDFGSYSHNNVYSYPSYFISCFPAKEINTVEKAHDIFEEIKIIDKEQSMKLCREKFEEENPLPVIEEEENAEEEE